MLTEGPPRASVISAGLTSPPVGGTGEVPTSPPPNRYSLMSNGDVQGTPSPSGSRIRNSANDERLAALKAKFVS